SPLVQDGVHLFCENSLSCKPQLVKSIVHYASREAMNIEGFSEKTAEQLFDKLNMKSIADLYRLKKEDLLNLDKFKEKKTDKLLKAIENSKNCKLPSFLFALSIPNVGIKTARDIVSKFKTLDRIISATSEELVEVSDVGDIVAYSVMEFFKDENILNTIKEILDLGVIPSYEEEQVVENPFLNKSVVVTGSLKNFSRIEIKEKLIELGAKAASSVSKKTDYILVGEEPGSKYEKGKALGITILTEEDFQKMIKS
ncbi:MAG: helix-hairpin-helix domain-containing protein, partial [Clostridiaceae bacterium]